MAVITPENGVFSTIAQKKTGVYTLYGARFFGLDCYGAGNERSGIYQRRRLNSGQKCIKMKFYCPINPQTIPQQANRTKFTNAIFAWQNLTTEQKAEYNTIARYSKRSGYNLFIKQYMLS